FVNADQVGVLQVLDHLQFVLQIRDLLAILAKGLAQRLEHSALPIDIANGFPHLASLTGTDQPEQPIGTDVVPSSSRHANLLFSDAAPVPRRWRPAPASSR